MQLNAFYARSATLGNWAKSSKGETTVFPSLSGMVVTPNKKGAWVGFKPAVGVRYDAEYDGMSVTVQNNGDGSYTLIHNGAQSRRVYDPRWKSSVYFDASGNPVSSIEAASDMSKPSQLYYNHGVFAADTIDKYQTSSSDGRNDVWATESGMVGFANANKSWVIFMPPKGVVYQSFYNGRQIAIVNNGDGSYLLTLNNQTTRRAYSGGFKPNVLYDARGNQIQSPDSARTESEPAGIFFTPGAAVAAADAEPVNPTKPDFVRPSPLLPPPTTANPPSGFTVPGGVSTSLSPVFPAPGDASWATGTFPDTETQTETAEPATSGIDGKTLLALAALALTALN